jgi:Fe-S cluster assembly protein SufD
MTTTNLDSRSLDVAAWSERALARATAAGEAAWALERRRAGTASAAVLPFPGRGDELWRRTDFRALETALAGADPFRRVAPARSATDLPVALRERLGTEAEAQAVVVQQDAGGVFERSHPDLERQGVVVASLSRALREHGARLEPLLGAQIAPDFDRYAALGALLHAGGAFVFVPDGVEAALPIRLFHGLAPGGLSAPHTVIALGRGARATVLEEQISEPGEGTAFHLGATEVFLGDGAKLVYATVQDWGRGVHHYPNARARVGRDAELQWIQIMVGGAAVKANAYFDLAGPGAQAFVHGFMFGDDRQRFHLHTLQRHLVDHTTSDLLIKGCLRDHARSVYQGLIQVSEGAQRTDAYQANRNLLLSDTARADSIPGLEILANDVRCTHGATIGSVDPEQMYYLMARGLPRAVAQRLIVEGFFAPVLDRIPLEAVRERLRAEIERKIG